MGNFVSSASEQPEAVVTTQMLHISSEDTLKIDQKENLGAGLPPSATEMVYVSKSGDDIKGDGRFFTPFLTIQRAMTSITDSSQTKMYAVIVGPGIYNDNFAFKPWVNVSGTPGTSAFEGVVQIGSGAVMSFDTSWTGTTYDVAWFTHLTFNNTPVFNIQNVNAQLTFFDCCFNGGASYTANHSGNVNNITWNACLSYGTVSVTDCQYFFLIGGSSILGSGPITITSTPAVAPTQTQLLALGCSINSTANPGLVFVSQLGAGGAVGDMRGCSVVSPLQLNGAACSYTSTVEGFPSNISFLNGAGVTNLHYYTLANALGYTPAVLGNWSGVSPVNVQNAFDRLAAFVGPVP